MLHIVYQQRFEEAEKAVKRQKKEFLKTEQAAVDIYEHDRTEYPLISRTDP